MWKSRSQLNLQNSKLTVKHLYFFLKALLRGHFKGSINIVEGGSPISNHMSPKMTADDPVEETSAELYEYGEDEDDRLRLEVDEMDHSGDRLIMMT